MIGYFKNVCIRTYIYQTKMPWLTHVSKTNVHMYTQNNIVYTIIHMHTQSRQYT